MYAGELRHVFSSEMNTLAHGSPAILAVTGWIIAQTSGIDPNVANLIGNGVTVAVLAFYVIFDIRVRTPNMLAAFAKEQADIRATFKQEQLESRGVFKETFDAMRNTFLAEQQALRAENRDDRVQIRQRHAEEIAEWRKMLNENMQAMRIAVHDVKDTASVAINETKLAVKRQTKEEQA